MGLFDAKPGGTMFGNIFRGIVSTVSKGAIQLQPKIPAPGQSAPVERIEYFGSATSPQQSGTVPIQQTLFGSKKEPTFEEKIKPYLPYILGGVGLYLLMGKRRF